MNHSRHMRAPTRVLGCSEVKELADTYTDCDTEEADDDNIF